MTSDDTARAADLEAALPVLDGLARRWAGFARTEPEDLRQNAALRFWRLRDHGDPRQGTPGQFAAYCTRSCVYNHRRLARVRGRELETVAVDPGRDAAREDPDLVELGDELEKLDRALRELPERFVMYLIRHYGRGEPYAQIAEEEGTDVASVRECVRAALASVRLKLGVPDPDVYKPRFTKAKLAAQRAELRRRTKGEAVRMLGEGVPVKEVVGRLGVADSTVRDWQREREAEEAEVCV